MDDDTMDRLLSGDLGKLPSMPKWLVRLFISSTFTDMTLERNTLMERVYPRLKKYCREQHGLDFQVVDMRWGVRDEATDDHQTVNLCSREIENCQRVSLGPNFIALIGDKYGFRPLLNRIKSTEYRLLRRCLIESDINTDFLDTWYKEDLNAVPAEYLLQPISSILKNFTNRNEPELQMVDQRIWQAIQERLHELLLIGSSRLVNQGRMSEREQLLKYSISVTEREILEGCLDINEPKSHCLVYVRSIVDLRDNLAKCTEALRFLNNGRTLDANTGTGTGSEGGDLRRDSTTRKASLKIGEDTISLSTSNAQNASERKIERTRRLISRYIDLTSKDGDWTVDEEAQKALTDLRTVKLASRLDLNGRNLTHYKVRWNEQDGISLKSDEHKNYLNDLTDHFYGKLTRMVRSAVKGERSKNNTNGLPGEVLQHSHYAVQMGKSVYAREDELDQIRSYILSGRYHQKRDALTTSDPILPMFVFGVSGSGKTSILARVASEAFTWIEDARKRRRSSANPKAVDLLQSSSKSQTRRWDRKPCVIMRFCCTTPESSSMVAMLTSVCRQLQYNFYQFGPLNGLMDQMQQEQQHRSNKLEPAKYDQLPYQQVPRDFVRLVYTFRQLIDNCRHPLHRQRVFVLILDSVERLSSPVENSIEAKYSWLTSITKLPSNVRLIVSCSSTGQEGAHLDYAHLKRHFLRAHLTASHQASPDFLRVSGKQSGSSSSGSSEGSDNESSNFSGSDSSLSERMSKEGAESDNEARPTKYGQLLRRLVLPAIRLKRGSRADIARMHSKEARNTIKFASDVFKAHTLIDLPAARESKPRDERKTINISERDDRDDSLKIKRSINYLGLLHIRPLGKDSAATVLRRWLFDSGRNLTQQQWTIVERSFEHCSRPIFVKLALGEVINWKSYSTQGDTKGLTFGSAWLAQMPEDHNESANTDATPRAKLMKLVREYEASTGSEEEANKFKWQMLAMEQQWLNFLDYKSRQEQQAAANEIEARGKEKNTNLVIRITGGGSVARTGGEQGNSLTNSSGSGSAGGSSSMSICHLSNTIEDAISQLFARIELQHGYLLTKHSLSYITAARSGICENELEDILSLDDVVLDDVFQYHLPPVRRIPPLLWTRIRNDLPDYLSERDADGIVITWHHSQFKSITQRRYLDDRKQLVYIHSLLADYFLGKWADKAKPFRCTKQQIQMAAEQLESAVQQSARGSASGQQATSPTGSMRGHLGSGSARVGASFSVRNRLRSSDQHDQRLQWMQAKAHRRVPHQPLYYDSNAGRNISNLVASRTGSPATKKQGESAAGHPEENSLATDLTGRRYNLRKLTELPYHLLRSGRFNELATCVLFNYKWLFASIEALGLQSLFADFQETLEYLRGKLSECNNREACESTSDQMIPELESNDSVPSDELDERIIKFMIEQLELLTSTLRLSSSIIQSEPQMLAPQLIGRLVSVVNQMKQRIAEDNRAISSGRGLDRNMIGALKQPMLLSELMQQCDKDGCLDCALLPIDHCLQSADGLQLSSLEGHPFGVMSMALASDQRHLLAVSSKFIMWNISTGEIAREIDPKINGAIMKELKIGLNNQLAISYTSDNHILVLDILTQQLAKSDRLLESEPIRGLKLMDRLGARRFVVWTESSLFVFTLKEANDITNNDASFILHQTDSDAISVELEYEIDISQQNSSLKSRDLLDVEISSKLKLDGTTDLIHCTLASQVDDDLLLWVCEVRRSGRPLSIEVWSCELKAASVVLSPSGDQIFYSTQGGEIFLRRRRAKSWSRGKLIRGAITNEAGRSEVASEIGASRAPLGLEVEDPASRVAEVDLEQQMSDSELSSLHRFETKVDRMMDGDEIGCLAVFPKALRDDSELASTPQATAVRFLKIHWPNRIEIIALEKTVESRRYVKKVLTLPRDVRDVRIEQNKCQLSSAIMQVPGEGDKHVLVVSSVKQLLVYSLDNENLLKCIDAHASRITKLLPIKQSAEAGGDLRFSIASSSLDRTIKIWNLSNITKESQSIDRLPVGQIDEMQICNQRPIAACLSRGRLSLWDWRTMKIVTAYESAADFEANRGQEERNSLPLMKCAFSSDGRHLAVATEEDVSVLLVEGPTNHSPSARPTSTSLDRTDRAKLKLIAKCPLPTSGIVIGLKFVSKDSRLLTMVRCYPDIKHNRKLSSLQTSLQTSTDSMSPETLELDHRVSYCLKVFCFAISDSKLQYQIECRAPQTNESSNMARQMSTRSSEKTGQQVWQEAKRNKLVALTCDQQFIVTLTSVSSTTSSTVREAPSRRRSSAVSRLPLALNVHSARDGSLTKTIDLSQLQKMYPQDVRRPSEKADDSRLLGQARNELRVQPETAKRQRSRTSSAATSRDKQELVSIYADQFNRLKSIKNCDRQTLVALLDDERGASYIIDISTKYLICCSNDWNGSSLSSDGRYGLSRMSKSAASRNFGPQTASRLATSGRPLNSAGLRLLEMRGCGSLKTLLAIEQMSEVSGSSELHPRGGIEREIRCGFTRPNDDYVYYCDSRLKRIWLIRLRDEQIVANYKLSCPVTGIKCTNDGFALVLAQLDGSLTSLAIVDPQASDTFTLLTQYPSRRQLD